MTDKVVATLNKRIDAVCKSSHEVGASIHAIAMECLKHAATHNNADPANRLVKGLHKSSRPVALQSWFETYSPIRWNGDGKVGVLKDTSPKFTPYNVVAAEADPYWEAKESVSKPLTLAALKAMIDQMEKKVDKASKGDLLLGEGENIIVMREFVNKLRAAA
jgi:hypothetical protein